VNQSGAVRAWILAYLLVAGAGLGALVGVGCAVKANFCPWRKPPAQTSTDGRTLYAANCAVCHGPDLHGGTNANAPSLVAFAAAGYTEDELAKKISRGKPLGGMPRFERILTPEQIRAVARFIISQRGGRG
jgi:mono/diheme cytochrome c family protein